MAIVQNPIIGTARKSAGGMVFTRSLDQNVIRAKPITYADRKSDKQLIQRNRMKATNGLTKADSKKALDALYPQRPNKQTRYSRFVQQVITVVTGLVNGFTLNFSVLPSMGNGTLPLLATNFSFSDDSGQIEITWTITAPTGSPRLSDKAFAFLFNERLKTGYSVILASTLSDNSGSFPVPDGWVMQDIVACYIGFTSNSEYNSTIAVKAVAN